MWFAIWAVLIIATGIGAFFLGRDLWRKVKALGRAASRASDLFADVADRIEAKSDELKAAAPSTAPTVFDDPVNLRARVLTVREQRAERRQAARVRHQATWERWRAAKSLGPAR